jgi:hypothetical protein
VFGIVPEMPKGDEQRWSNGASGSYIWEGQNAPQRQKALQVARFGRYIEVQEA